MRTLLIILGLASFMAATGCSTVGSPAGTAFAHTDSATGERAEGVELGGINTALALPESYWMHWMRLTRETEAGSFQYYWSGRIHTAPEFRVQSLKVTLDGSGSRTFPARRVGHRNYTGPTGPRNIETFAAWLSADDVRWLGTVQEKIELHLDGERAWAEAVLNKRQVEAVRQFAAAQ
jgi:hypothetical protein